MSKTGRIMEYDFKTGKLLRVIEPINNFPERNANWEKGLSNLPVGGSIKEEDSIITEENGFKNITYK